MEQFNPTLITFIFYIIAMVGIGLYAYKAIFQIIFSVVEASAASSPLFQPVLQI